MAVNREEILELCRTNPEAIVDIIERQDRIITQLTEKICTTGSPDNRVRGATEPE